MNLFNAAAEFVDRHIPEGRGNHAAIRCSGKTFTYLQVSHFVNRVGNSLRALGVEMEDRVMLLLRDSPEFAFTFFGAIKIGAVPVPVNTMMRAKDFEFFLNDSRAKVLVAHADLWNEISGDRARFPFLRNVVVVEGSGSHALEFSNWIIGASADLEPSPTTRDDTAFWLYSSGSTGFPKGAIHQQRNMVACADCYARQVLDLRADDVIFSAAKLFFAYGLGNGLYFPFHAGATSILLPERPTPRKVYEIIEREKPTLFFGVPTLYAAMLAESDKAWNLSSLRLCISAGEPLPAELYRRWKNRFGTEILDGIGTTELLHIFISNRPGKVKPGSSGTLVPGYEAKIVDEREEPVGTGEMGNLVVRGESLCSGYWNQRERTRQVIHGDWITTGDKYYRDADDYYWYCGRSDDMIKAGGIWVSPIEVEGTLIEHPAVLEAAVVAAVDADGLEKPKAFVVLKTGSCGDEALVAELKEFVKGRIAPYKYPRWIEFVADLPKTATGKIQRFKLRGRAGVRP